MGLSQMLSIWAPHKTWQELDNDSTWNSRLVNLAQLLPYAFAEKKNTSSITKISLFIILSLLPEVSPKMSEPSSQPVFKS
jgi:hypothetical protein